MPKGTQPDNPIPKIAKLLRVICDRSLDGETLAAADRLSAIVAAHDLDWDRALNGAGPELTREHLQQVYQAGVEEGVRLAREARGQRDWAPAGQSRTDEAGERADELEALLDAAERAEAAGYLDTWFREFTNDMRARYERWGVSTFVSERQWECLNRLRAKLERGDFL
jgi:hypothetical protein